MQSETYKEIEGRELRVDFRPGAGKGVARKLRKEGRIPGIFYGSKSEPIPMSLTPEEMVEALRTPKLKNTLIRMISDHNGLNGRLVLVKEIQRHPISRAYLHVDFMEVYPDQPVRAMVPVTIKGHAKGVDLGGTLDQHLRYVDIKCAADKIPSAIEVEVSELEIGGSIKLGQLSTEEGVELMGERHAAVVSVAAPRVAEVEEAVAEGEEEEAAAPAEAEPGAEEKPTEGEKPGKKE